MSEYVLLSLTLLCLALMGGLNIYLAISLMQGFRVDDRVLKKLVGDMKYMTLELASIGRSVRSRPTGGLPEGESGDDDAAFSSFEKFQQSGFQEIGNNSMDAHRLLQEFSELKGKELAAWKDANQARLDKIRNDQAALHGKLVEAQEMLDNANQTIRQLRSKNNRLAGADAKVKALESINQGLDAELHTVKNHGNRLSSDLALARKDAEELKNKLVAQDAKFKELHETYLRDRQQLEAEKNALELRLASMQQAFDQSVMDLDSDNPLREVHEKFKREREALEVDKRQLESQLHALQASFDRTLVEKAFIESVFLEMEGNAAPGEDEGILDLDPTENPA